MENLNFIGKFLVRPGKTHGGKKIVTLTGVFECDNPDGIHNHDEMWVGRLSLTGGKVIKYKDYIGKDTSPEDFLEGEDGSQNPKSWKEKEVIQLPLFIDEPIFK